MLKTLETLAVGLQVAVWQDNASTTSVGFGLLFNLEALATVVQRIAGMPQHPKWLDTVKKYCRREAQKKASVEARLTAPLELYRVCMGLSKPHNVLSNVQDFHRCWQRLESEHGHSGEPQGHAECLVSCSSLQLWRTSRTPPCPRCEETQDLIKQGALLQAPQKLMDPEGSPGGLTERSTSWKVGTRTA